MHTYITWSQLVKKQSVLCGCQEAIKLIDDYVLIIQVQEYQKAIYTRKVCWLTSKIFKLNVDVLLLKDGL